MMLVSTPSCQKDELHNKLNVPPFFLEIDHPGVPNPQLIREDKEVGALYKGRSVAEQKSFEISWNLLMEDRFRDLLCTICSTPMELQRFRQLVINR